MGNVNAVGHSARANQLRGSGREAVKSSEVANGWDELCVQRLLVEGKLAARGCGSAEPSKASIECPICFLYYGTVNATTCCQQPVCTECYLKVRPVRRGATDCPFCGKERFAALVQRRDECKEVPVVSQAYAKGSSSSSLKVLPAHEEADERICCDKVVAAVDEEAAWATPVASVEDRLKVEDEMRRQLDESRRRGDSGPPPPPPAQSRPRPRQSLASGLGLLARLRADRNANLTLDDLHALVHALPTDLQQVEDLMILEAMQASLDDEDRRRSREADTENITQDQR
mmetsp:Transcript_1512/g.4556  ORF Transcript_1512/g.4556 Transcript_1512/m.4556 type:complete len:287 (+) Transcript_1512:299-1159(+)